jgi:hypothetical protein
VLAELRRVLIQSEDDIKNKLSAQKPNVEAGVWIEQLTTQGSPGAIGLSPNLGSAGMGANASGGTIILVCRAVNLNSVDPSANNEVAYAVENQLKSSPMFDPKTTQLSGQITPDDSNGTFTFGIIVTLQNPLKL